MSELQIIIDWYQSIDSNTIINKILSYDNLKIHQINNISPLENRETSLYNFYGHGHAPKTYGAQNFTVYFIIDKKPLYDFRNTSTGYRKINTSIFDIKYDIRHNLKKSIHGTDNIEETKRNLKALNLYHFYQQKNFENFDDFFHILNKGETPYYLISYEIIRYKNINNDYTIKINTKDYYNFKQLTDLSEDNQIKINNIKYKFDVYNNYENKNIDNDKRINDLLVNLQKNNIKLDDICIVGSYILDYYNIREAGDIDVIISHNITNYNEIIKKNGFDSNWYGEIDDEEIIYNNKYHIKLDNGLKILRLEYLLDWKKNNNKRILSSCKEKDSNDLLLFDNKCMEIQK